MIDLYAAPTSNGIRARIALEECGLQYKLHPIDLQKGENKTPQYLAMNPMGQIPVLIDNEGPGGKKVTLAQSSAIMMYCAVLCSPLARSIGCQLYLRPHSSSAMRARMPFEVPAA